MIGSSDHNHGFEWENRSMSDCAGKEAFSDPQLARAVLRRIKRTAKSGKRKSKQVANREVYRCSACRQWHLGRSNGDIG